MVLEDLLESLPVLAAQARAGDKNNSRPDTGQVQALALTLPKGGGAIRGIGEKFGANPVTGTGSMNVPIATRVCVFILLSATGRTDAT
jgi:hypothetical protein